MKKGKLCASLLLCTALFCTPHVAHAFDAMDFERGPLPITVHVDGEFLPMDVAPTVTNGRTLVPLRAAGEAVGATIQWDGSTRSAIAIINDKNVRFTLGSKTYTVNGVKHQADVAPVVKNNRTLLPLRAFGEACGVKVSWDNNLRDVIIDTPAENAIPLLPAGVSNDTAMMIRKYYVQNEPNTSIVGNWQGETKLHTYDGINATTIKNYLFIARYGDEYQAVLLSTERANFYTGTGIFVQKLSILQMPDNTFYISGAAPNTNTLDESILYYRVPGNGYSMQLMYELSKFELYEDQLIRTEKPNNSLGWEECYEPYTKF